MNSKIIVLGLVGVLVALVVAGTLIREEPIQRYESTVDMMDTYVTVVVYDNDEAHAKAALDAAIERMEEVAGIANRFDPASEVSRLNDNGTLMDPSPELVDMLELCKEYWTKTNGTFDVTIMPLLNLWSGNSPDAPFLLFDMSASQAASLDTGNISASVANSFNNSGYTLDATTDSVRVEIAGQEWNVTSGWKEFMIKKNGNRLDVYTKFFWNVESSRQKEFIDDRMPLIGSDKITIGTNKITLQPGMKLTLDGMAKGYIVDEGLKILEDEGITSALIDAGGDMGTLGMKPGDDPWVIGLRNPEDKTESITEFELSGQAIATSGNYERYFNESLDVGYIIDPATGMSTRGIVSSSTVIAQTCAEADILATTLFVMGPVKGLELANQTAGVEALLLDDDDPQVLFRSLGIYEFEVDEVDACGPGVCLL